MFIAALFLLVMNWEQPRVISRQRDCRDLDSGRVLALKSRNLPTWHNMDMTKVMCYVKQPRYSCAFLDRMPCLHPHWEFEKLVSQKLRIEQLFPEAEEGGGKQGAEVSLCGSLVTVRESNCNSRAPLHSWVTNSSHVQFIQRDVTECVYIIKTY